MLRGSVMAVERMLVQLPRVVKGVCLPNIRLQILRRRIVAL